MPSINTPTVESLHIYPIKSCHGVQVQECKVDNLGIKYDRQFMIIYADNNRFITQRKYTSLVFLHPTWDESNNTFTLSAKGQEPLHLPLTQDLEKLSKREVDLWKSDLTVYDMGDEAGDWVTQFLTNNRHLDHFNEPVRPVRLVTLDDPKNGVYSRQTHPQLQGIHSPFTDYSPISIGFTTSLQEVNKGLLQTGISQGVQIPMNRFRNNIIISGTVPWEEDQWLVARVGEVVLYIIQPTARCPVPGIDQDTGVKDDWKGKGMNDYLKVSRCFAEEPNEGQFCCDAAPLTSGTIHVGDKIEILETIPPEYRQHPLVSQHFK